jgi:hypothetical protein
MHAPGSHSFGPLHFAEGDGYGPQGGANGGEQAADDAHDERKENAHEKKVEGDLEGEGQVGEGLKIHGASG